MTIHRTKTDAALEEAERAHADDPERADLLRRARRFKSSWIELAQGLTGVKHSGRWKEWGYDSLEAYAKSELRLRAETVDKLTGSYTFLQRKAPSVLARDVLTEPIPSYDAVDFLRRAEESNDAPRRVVEAIRKRVLDDAAPARAVSKEYRDTVFPIDDAQRKARDAAGLRNVATRLRELLAETRVVPRKLAGEVGESLQRLLDALPQRKDDAA